MEVVQNQNITFTGTQGCRPAEDTLCSKFNYSPCTHCTMCYCSQKASSLSFYARQQSPDNGVSKNKSSQSNLAASKDQFLYNDDIWRQIKPKYILAFNFHCRVSSSKNTTACPLPHYVPPTIQLIPHKLHTCSTPDQRSQH